MTVSTRPQTTLSRRLWFIVAALLIFSFQAEAGAETADKVVVKKASRKLMLQKNGKTIRSYRISLGGNPVGHKREQGDQRTPEGDYVLDYRNRNSKFYKSIHVSYPSGKDRSSAKSRGVNPGGMIMIHGAPNKAPSNWLTQAALKVTDWTDGCIAVTNGEMDEIWTMVRDGTPIRIDP